jgi:hypothetical protein
VSVWRHGWSRRAASGRCRLTEEVGQADSGALVEEQTRGGVEVVGLAVGEPIDVEARAAMPPEDMVEVCFDSPSSPPPLVNVSRAFATAASICSCACPGSGWRQPTPQGGPPRGGAHCDSGSRGRRASRRSLIFCGGHRAGSRGKGRSPRRPPLILSRPW